MPPNLTDPSIEVLHARLSMLHESVDDVKGALRELTSAIAKLAVVEAQQAQVALALERVFQKQEQFDGRVAALEKSLTSMSKSSDWLEKVFFLAVGAGVTTLVTRLIAL